MMMMMMFTYIDFIHDKKLENYAPYVKYRPSKKGISKKKATNNTIKLIYINIYLCMYIGDKLCMLSDFCI
jgi:hypothetical protein